MKNFIQIRVGAFQLCIKMAVLKWTNPIGTIEEKIYQRQVMKSGLAGGLESAGLGSWAAESAHFTPEELRKGCRVKRSFMIHQFFGGGGGGRAPRVGQKKGWGRAARPGIFWLKARPYILKYLNFRTLICFFIISSACYRWVLLVNELQARNYT